MNFKTAAILTVLGSALAVSSAKAAVTVGFDIGNVAIGYSDGYYDSGHHWHKWRHHADLDQYRRPMPIATMNGVTTISTITKRI